LVEAVDVASGAAEAGPGTGFSIRGWDEGPVFRACFEGSHLQLPVSISTLDFFSILKFWK